MFAVYLMYRHRDIGAIVYQPRHHGMVFVFTKEMSTNAPLVYRQSQAGLPSHSL